ncbi:MAG TPA: iron-containing alcohol dehydrogenase family protein [Candidatus Atribacteria bacterium]|nr:iron-containing alcohol dehydrogenase family protein [Candidatus Atribacteria bacterium]
MQREYFGIGSIKILEEVIREYNARRLFLVCGKNSFRLSGAEKKIKPFIENLSYITFNPMQNPKMEDIKSGIVLFEKFNPDVVIAIGGGSIIDSAKAINVLSFKDEDPIKYITGKRNIEKKEKLLIAIPTTAGSGSESTQFATIYVKNRKYSIESEKVIPDIAIVDPSLTFSLPKYITAYTGLDALCQGLESYWSIHSTEVSQNYAKEAIQLAYNNIRKAIENDREGRVAMAKAANLSGKAINISKTTACHSISYPLTAYFGIPHGHAVSLAMPFFLEFNSYIDEENCNDNRGTDFVREKMHEIFSLLGVRDGEEAKKVFNNLLNILFKKTRLRDWNIKQRDLRLILKESFTSGRMNNNPKKVSKESLGRILEMMW